MELVAIKTNNEYYVAIKEHMNDTYGHKQLMGYLINGEKPEKTYHLSWVKVKNKPETLVSVMDPSFSGNTSN